MDFLFLPRGKKIFLNLNFAYFYLVIFFIITFTLSFIVFFNLQFFYKAEAQEVLDSSRYLTFFYFPPRGRIFDRYGKILADSKKVYDVYANFQSLTEEEKNLLTEILEKDKPLYFYWGDELIIRFLELEQVSKILANKEKFPNLFLIPSYKRIYFGGEAFGNLIGYLGLSEKNSLELEGKMGIEAFYNDVLRGKPGRIVYQKIKGKLVKILEEEPIPGNDIYLTIDKELQQAIYQEFKNYFQETNYQKGGFILTDPRNGEVITLISYPSFDSSIFLEKREEIQKILTNKNNPLFNRIIGGLYSPGSTIKIIIGGAALEEKIVTPQTKIYSAGEIRIPHPYFPGVYSVFKDNKIHGWTDIYKAIADSVNVYFYLVGGGYPYPNEELPIKNGLGIERLVNYFKKFNLGEKTGIDFPGEKAGVLPQWENRQWRLGDTYNVAIGQGEILVTPLQINLWTSYFTYGKIYRPHLLKKIVDNEGKTIFEAKDLILKENIISQENWKIIKEAMRLTVTQGTAKILNDLPLKLAGKSGSPQILGKEKLNAIFTGFAPFEKPEITATILIEEVPYGSVASLPLFKNIMSLYYQLKINGRNSF